MDVVQAEGAEVVDHNRAPFVSSNVGRQRRSKVPQSSVMVRLPALSLREATGLFTEAAYGRRLDFEHA